MSSSLQLIIDSIVIFVHTAQSVTEFGFKTTDNAESGTPNNVSITLYWNEILYQCTVQPIAPNSVYTCNTSSATNFSQCEQLNLLYGYAIQIDNSLTNSLEIDQLIIITNDTTLIYDTFCFNIPPTLHQQENLPFGNCSNSKYNGYQQIGINFAEFYPHLLFEFDPKTSATEAYLNQMVRSTPQSECVYLYNQYFALNQSISWADAAEACAICNSEVGSMAAIHSYEDYVEIVSICTEIGSINSDKNNSCWIGLRDEDEEWEWNDNSETDYAFDENIIPLYGTTPWADNIGNFSVDSFRDCVGISQQSNYTWVPQDCYEMTKYPICKHKTPSINSFVIAQSTSDCLATTSTPSNAPTTDPTLEPTPNPTTSCSNIQ